MGPITASARSCKVRANAALGGRFVPCSRFRASASPPFSIAYRGRMPYDGNGNYIETCGDQCISNRYAKDSGKACQVETAPPVLCGFGCGGYGDPTRGGMCARCIGERGMEDVFPKISIRPADLVDLATLHPSLRFDIKYARVDNFMGRVLYPSARALLQRPAAEALGRVQASLASRNLGLLVYDAYRPWSVTKAMWDKTPAEQRMFVADPAVGSKHNRGCAVDATLCQLITGEPLPMPSAFDEFTERAFADYAGACREEQLQNRTVLIEAMSQEGFMVNPREWWHFDHCLWEEFEVLDVPLP